MSDRSNLIFCASATALALGVASSAFSSFTNFSVDLVAPAAGQPIGTQTYRVYANFTNANDQLLSVFAATGNLHTITWSHQDLTGPVGSMCVTLSEGSPSWDSYLTIGGIPGISNPTLGDASWGPVGINQPGIPNGAGWWDPVPSDGRGIALTLKVLVANLTKSSDSAAFFAAASVTWRNGPTGPVQFGSGTFAQVPGPSGMALLAIAGLFRPARRRA